MLSFFGEAVGVFEVRLGHADVGGGAVHEGDEGGFAAGDISSECFGEVVSAFDEETFDELAAGVLFASADVEFGGDDIGVCFDHGDGVFETAGAGDAECGEEFLSAGDGAGRAGIFLVEDASGDGVEDDGTLGGELRSGDGGEVWFDLSWFDENGLICGEGDGGCGPGRGGLTRAAGGGEEAGDEVGQDDEVRCFHVCF